MDEPVYLKFVVQRAAGGGTVVTRRAMQGGVVLTDIFTLPADKAARQEALKSVVSDEAQDALVARFAAKRSGSA